MRNSDYILNWTEDLKKEIALLPFDKEDIRTEFFNFIYDIAYTYYIGNLTLALSDIKRENHMSFDRKVAAFEPHIHKLDELTKKEELSYTYLNSLNRNLFLGAWSTFELCTTLLCDAVVSSEEKEKLLSSSYNDILKQFKQSCFNLSDLDNLKQTHTVIHLTHVSITRKTDLLFNKATNYPKDRKENDKIFLLFFGRYRNAMHTNYIYFAKRDTKTLSHKFGDMTFRFENGKIINCENMNIQPTRLFLNLITELKDVWKLLISNIDHKDLIPYPDDRQK